MKKNLFWKIIVAVIIVLILVWFRTSLIVISANGTLKHDKLTGRAYRLTDEGWERMKKEKKKEYSTEELFK